MINRNTELEQSILRIILVCSFLIYTIIVEYIMTGGKGSAYPAIIIGMFYSLASIVIFINIKKHPGYHPTRKIIGMVSDICATSFSMFYLGEYGVPLFAAYPWVIIGNGFRYGIKYLIFCSVLSVAGFICIATQNVYWPDRQTLLWSGLIILTVVPIYVAVLLHRLETEKMKAELASKEKSRFLANISHEIRTPLNAVVGFSELLDKSGGETDNTRIVKRIKDSANSLLTLVDGVLDFSRIESGHVMIEHEPVDLKELADSLYGMFSLQAEGKGIAFNYSINPDVPPVIVGDKNRLRQILVNLVGNAMKFTESGKVEFVVDHMQRGEGNNHIRFTVADTGIGIQDEMVPVIFERFRQADDTAQRQYGGTGLGTAIAKHLVELMGGEIGLESQCRIGSRFWFTIPCLLPVDNARATDGITSQGPGRITLPADMQYQVLVADDSVINRLVIKGMLDWIGVGSILAESGPVALEILCHENTSLMILDIQMPGMSGLDVIRKYHAITDMPKRIPIVIITGDATVDVQQECAKLGVEDFLTKPVELDNLHRIINRHVFRHTNKAATG